MTLESIWIVIGIFLGSSLILVGMILLNQYRLRRQDQRQKWADDYLIDRFLHNTFHKRRVSWSELLMALVRISEQVYFSVETKQQIYFMFQEAGTIQKTLRQLRSFSPFIRKRASQILACFDSSEIRKNLTRALKIEKLEHVKLYLLNALKNKIDQHVLKSIIDSIVGSRRYYQSRLIGILERHLLKVEAHLQNIFKRPEMEIKEVFVDLTNIYYREEFKPILTEELAAIERYLAGEFHPTFSSLKKTRVTRLYYQVLRALANVYDTPLNDPKYLGSSDPEIVKIATDSFSSVSDIQSISMLMTYADGSDRDDIRAQSILRMIEADRRLLDELVDRFSKITDTEQKSLLAQVLSHKIEYLILKFIKKDAQRLTEIIHLMIDRGHTADLIDFLNQKQPQETLRLFQTILQPLILEHPTFQQEMTEYLQAERLTLFGLKKTDPISPAKPVSLSETKKTRWLVILLVISLIILPLTYLIIISVRQESLNFWEMVADYIVSINRWFIVYYLSVNGLYLILALFSLFGSIKQNRLWSIKTNDLLFEEGMLPSISIIAPAYNEEKSIVESVNSLLNLNYPNFEVIVVNDGSKDQTLQELIDHFQLERKNFRLNEKIPTQPIKAIYRNRYLPSLMVVDKLNGGKADALNVGINLAKADYICGIDADSILEKDSLLKLMSSMLDHDRITLALGGSIVPVNGSIVDHGQIEAIGLGKSALVRFQTIEYLRAFNISRTGFSSLRSLLIVSGAFGLFEKRILTEVGGYLTVSSLKKNTVGEDMELVVRITRRALEMHLKFRVDYIGHARCHTEVPEERKSLFRQRNRWQRGLVDILSYHRKMIFNPKYKQPGLIGMPYFFIFEMMGPLLEIQAYFAIFIGIIFGLLNAMILLLLLFVTVIMGIFLSLFSLFINEMDRRTYSWKDIRLLVLYAILENFGWRQLISLYRVKGYLSSLKETHVWGQMNRIGFKK
ncbi:MAG: glycosyltransferase [Candidatus Izemoplasmatales bacterium]